jgi:hypothetical protein
MAGPYDGQRAEDGTAFGGILKAWPVGSTVLPSNVKAVLFNADGTADLTNSDDSTEAAVPVLKMVPLPFVPKKVTAMATATKCYIVLP